MSASVFLACLCIGAMLLASTFHKYCQPAQYEDVGKSYGLKRRRWEPVSAWEDRIWQATKRRLDTSDALMYAAFAAGLIVYFPPRQRPTMPAGVTWTTGVDFACGLPFVVWLPNEHPLAVAFRAAHATPPEEPSAHEPE